MRRPFASHDARAGAGWLALAVIVAGAVLVAGMGPVLGDEGSHLHQVRLFGRGLLFDARLTTIPGWHALAAVLLAPFGEPSLHGLRLLTALTLLPAAWAMYRVRKALGAPDAQRSTAALLLLPALFPFWFLAYTDAPALALLLLALLASVRGRHGLAALALGGALLVRQHLVFWCALLALAPLASAWAGHREGAPHALRTLVVQLRGYALVVLLFCAWWAWNGAIAFAPGETVHHPDVRVDVGNPLYLLLLAAVLLPLHVAAGLRRFLAAARRHPWWWLLPAAVLLAAWLLFRVRHPYNLIAPEYFLRNALLLRIDADPVLRAAFAGLAALAACGLSQTRFYRPGDRALLPLGLLFVSASLLVETRYAIVPLALWLALRRPQADWIERTTLAWWAVCSGVLLAGMLDLRFMP